MEENKPRRVDFHCGVTGERCVSGRDDDVGLHLVFSAANRWVPGLEIGQVTGGWRTLLFR